jgi:hypothetical protein
MYGKIYKNWSPYFAGLESREPTYLPTYLSKKLPIFIAEIS